MIDSHCHLDFKEYKHNLDDIINNALSSGVHTLFNIGADMHSSIRSVELANKYDCIYATVGIHPHDAATYNQEIENRLLELIKDKKVVAIGEIGLDYYRDLSPRHIQKQVFRKQLEIAIQYNMPVVIHTRESFGETINIVREYRQKLCGGVFHCFPGTIADAKQVFDIGFHISVGGIITFPKAKMAEVAANVPLEYILLETDSPYLAPAPFRGKNNQPAYIKYIRDKLAELRKISVDEVESATDNNCRRAYRQVDTFGG
jgi:TatD DNase family protein